MADEFPEHDYDAETPSADELNAAYSSQYLGVVDVGDKKIRTKIAKVRMVPIEDRKTGRIKKKAAVYFEGVDKPLLANAGTKATLQGALGTEPAGWKGASVGIKVDPNVMFGGKKVGGVRLTVLLPPAPATPASPAPNPAPAAAKPAPKPATTKAETPSLPEEEGDPGADFNDMVPDLSV